MGLKSNIFFTFVLSAPIIKLIVENIIYSSVDGMKQNIAFSILAVITLIILWSSYFIGKVDKLNNE